MRYIGFYLSLLFVVSAGNFPYSISVYSTEEIIRDFCRSEGKIYLLGERKVFQWTGKSLKSLATLNFRANFLICVKDRLLFGGKSSLKDIKGKDVFNFPSPLFGYIKGKEKIYLVFRDFLANLNGNKIPLPSPVLILGRETVLGRDWFFSPDRGVEKLPLAVSFQGSQVLKGLAWRENGKLVFARDAFTSCFLKDKIQCFNTSGRLKLLGLLGPYLWVIAKSGEEFVLRVFPAEGENVPGRLREQILPYIPQFAEGNGHMLVLGGEEGGVEIYTENLENAFTIPPVKYSHLTALKIYDLDSDGEKDFLLGLESINPEKSRRWKGIAFIYSRMKPLKKEIQKYLASYRKELRRGNYLKALSQLEEALYLENFLDPQRGLELFALRKELLRKIWIRKKIKSIMPWVGMGLLSLFLLFLIIKLIPNLNVEKVPPDEDLESLSKSGFLHSLSHFLRYLLSAKGKEFQEIWKAGREDIRRYLEVIENEAKFEGASPDWKKLRGEIRKLLSVLWEKPDKEAAEKLILLVLDLRERVHSLQSCLLSVLRKAAEKMHPIASSRHIHIILNLSPGPCYVPIFPQAAFQYENAFAEIIRNAIDALEQAGDGKEREIYIEGEEDANHVKVIIRDNGIGISPEDLPKIFQPGWTKGKKQGSGYGLAGVDRLFEKYGRIVVNSKPGEGTEFQIIWGRELA